MDGIIILNKHKNITSFGIIRELRKLLGTKKIGHCGTLDPLATGVLIVCVGKATKLVSEIEKTTKGYIVEMEFGYETNTYDSEGEINYTTDKKVEKNELESVLNKFLGKIYQEPPMFSAIKVNGEKLYNLARKGIEIERKKREVYVYDLKIIEFNKNTLKLYCRVSKGFYVRSLVKDIGRELNNYATMINLNRISVGENFIENSYTLDEIKRKFLNGDTSFILKVENYFNFQKINITEKDIKFFRNGNKFEFNEELEEGLKRVYYQNEFLGIGKFENGILSSYKYF